MRRKILICLIAALSTTIFTGCNKKFWDYDCVWVSDSPYVYMPAKGHTAIVEIDG